MAIVNKLSVILEAKTKDFANGMKRADDKVKKFAESNRTLGDVVKNAGKAIASVNPIVAAAATIAVGATVAIVKLTTATAAYAEGLQKMSVRLGISTETLSKMEFAAQQSGSSLRAMTPMFRSLSRAAFEANRGIKTYSDAFDALGVVVKDSRTGALKPMEQLLGEVADAMQKTENQTEKLALAQQVLGRGAVDLLPLLEGGSEGIRALMDEAESLGATVSTKFANQSADFVDNLGRIKTIGRGLGITISEEVLPHLNGFLDTMVRLARRVLPQFREGVLRVSFEITRLSRVATALTNAVRKMAEQEEKAEKQTSKFGKGINDAILSFVFGIKESESLGDAIRRGGAKAAEASDIWKELSETLNLSFEEWKKNREKAEETGETLDTVVTPAVQRFKGVLGDTLVTVQTFSENLEELIAAGLAQGPMQASEQQAFMAGLGEQTDGVADKVKNLGETFREFFDSTFDGVRTLFNAFDTLASSIGKGLIDALKGGKVVFADFFKSLMEQLLQAILRALILQTILSFIPGFGGFAGFKAGFFGQLTRGLGGPLPAPAGGGGGGGGGNTGPITGGGESRAPIDPGVNKMNVVIHEATPQTWVEITDNEIEPRLLTRREELGSEI